MRITEIFRLGKKDGDDDEKRHHGWGWGHGGWGWGHGGWGHGDGWGHH